MRERASSTSARPSSPSIAFPLHTVPSPLPIYAPSTGERVSDLALRSWEGGREKDLQAKKDECVSEVAVTGRGVCRELRSGRRCSKASSEAVEGGRCSREVEVWGKWDKGGGTAGGGRALQGLVEVLSGLSGSFQGSKWTGGRQAALLPLSLLPAPATPARELVRSSKQHLDVSRRTSPPSQSSAPTPASSLFVNLSSSLFRISPLQLPETMSDGSQNACWVCGEPSTTRCSACPQSGDGIDVVFCSTRCQVMVRVRPLRL